MNSNYKVKQKTYLVNHYKVFIYAYVLGYLNGEDKDHSLFIGDVYKILPEKAESTVRTMMMHLKRNGYFNSPFRGYYQLTNKGIQRMNYLSTVVDIKVEVKKYNSGKLKIRFIQQ